MREMSYINKILLIYDHITYIAHAGGAAGVAVAQDRDRSLLLGMTTSSFRVNVSSTYNLGAGARGAHVDGTAGVRRGVGRPPLHVLPLLKSLLSLGTFPIHCAGARRADAGGAAGVRGSAGLRLAAPPGGRRGPAAPGAPPPPAQLRPHPLPGGAACA